MKSLVVLRCVVAGLLLAWPARVVLADTISGKVFLDANANGSLDAGEQGLPDVRLTDGMQFVTTDADGSYSINTVDDPVLRDGGAQFISVCFPSGYWPTAAWSQNLAETKGGQPVNFDLRQDKQSLPFTFIHATDPHVPRNGKDRFIGFKRDIAELRDQIKFCILTGDLVDLSDSHPYLQSKGEFEFFAEQTRDFPVPLFCLPGNHDIAGVRSGDTWDKQGPDYGYGFFSQHVGPLRWAFDCAGIHFVGLDFNNFANDKWGWGIPDSAVKWFEADLNFVKPGARVFLFVHAPVGSDYFYDVVKKHNVAWVFHGHDHRERVRTVEHALVITSGSVAEIFSDNDRLPGYRIVHVTNKRLDMFYRYTGQPHSIIVDHPRWDIAFKSGDMIRGAFYDPDGKINSLKISIGDFEQQIPFERGPVCCNFSSKLDVNMIDEGVRPVTLTVSDGQDNWQRQHNYLFVTGRYAEFAAQQEAVLELDAGGIDLGAEIYLNDSKLAQLSPTELKGDGNFPTPINNAEIVKLVVPPDSLRRLNKIEARALKTDDDAIDRFFLLDARMTCGGNTFRDLRLVRGPNHPNYIDSSSVYWIDLTPGK